MIDIKFVRETPELIEEILHKRNLTFPLNDLLNLDKERRELITNTQIMKRKKNLVSQEIADRKKRGEQVGERIVEMKHITDNISDNDPKIRSLEEKIKEFMMRLPNIPHDSVPVSKDETGNVEIRQWGMPRKFNFPPKDHIDICNNLKMIDLERAAKVAGSRFYFLENDLVLLNHALISFSLDFLAAKGFSLIQPPYMLRKEAMEGAIILSDFEDVIYKVEDEDLYLIGTSEHPLLSMHMNETFNVMQMPIRYAGVSPCFRKEAGAHGRDTKGIFRVHQFEKIEQFVFSKPEYSWEQFEVLINNAEEVFQKLQLPYRIVVLSTGDMGKVPAKTYDLEAWLPGQGEFRELVSCSNCTDFQSRALNIKYREKPHEEAKLVHTLNSTLVATERTLIAILENHQLEDGSVNIPDVLQSYMGGKKVISPIATHSLNLS